MNARADQRLIGILLHPTREEAIDVAADFVTAMHDRGVACITSDEPRARELRRRVGDVEVGHLHDIDTADLEVIVVFGGDGSILRAAELAVPAQVPLLGVNLGHVGFLAELESHDVDDLAAHIFDRQYSVERRLTLHVTAHDAAGEAVWQTHAVNEVSVEKLAREKMLNVLVEIDSRPVSRWSSDGVVVSTPTGSTAYGFSLGGPVIWPDVEAFMVIPIAAHALFARPLVLDPTSIVDISLSDAGSVKGIVWCDGRRSVELEPGSRLHVRRGIHDMLVVRLKEQPFTSRLVKKFNLDIDGFRGAPS